MSKVAGIKNENDELSIGGSSEYHDFIKEYDSFMDLVLFPDRQDFPSVNSGTSTTESGK